MRDRLVRRNRSPLSPFESSTRSGWAASVTGYRLALAVVVVAGLGLRLWNLGAAPLWVDESFSTWAAWNFLHGQGFSDPVGPTSPYRRGWLTTTLPISASFALLGPTEFAARLPSAILGTVAIVAVYLLGAQFNRPVGLLVAMLTALDPFMLVWAREARMYVHLQLLYVLAVYLLLRWRSEARLELRSRYPVALAVVCALGLGTSKAFLAFGGVFLVFVGLVLVRHGVVRSGRSPEGATLAHNAVGLAVLGFVLAGVFVVVSGVPDVLTAGVPEQWPAREVSYYWEFFTETYPVLWLLGAAGLAYLLLGDEREALVVVAFLVPFLVASAAAQKAPRYVYYLLPLFFLLAIVPAVHFSQLLIAGVAQRIQVDRRSELRRIGIAMLLLFVLVVTPPAQTLAAAQQLTDPPFHPPRSAFDEASAFVAEHADEDAIVMSTRPELSLWYLNRTDYFFRQRGIKHVRRDGDRLVHYRTGTVVVTNESVLRDAMAEDREIWLLAGKKFEQGFTSPAMRRFVRSRFTVVDHPPWENMVVYYWSPFITRRSFGEADALGATTGNAFVASIEDREYLALGRTVDTTVQDGTQGDSLTGQATIRVSVRTDEPVVIRMRTYGANAGERFVTASVSTDGERWRSVARNDDSGWTEHRVVVPAAEIESAVLTVRFEGGTNGQNRYGGLVDYVHVYSLRDWERAYLADAPNSSVADRSG